MSEGIGLAEALLGLDRFRVLGVAATTDELVITIESTATVDAPRAVLASRRTIAC